MKLPRQCAALIGGLGTRLGSLTANTPKPLLDCGGRPFLFWVLRELSRFGIEEIVLLAGYRSERVEEFCREAQALLPKSLTLTLSVEPEPAGTGARASRRVLPADQRRFLDRHQSRALLCRRCRSPRCDRLHAAARDGGLRAL